MNSIRKKITAGFLVLIALLLFSGASSYFELQKLTRRTEAVIEMEAATVAQTHKVTTDRAAEAHKAHGSAEIAPALSAPPQSPLEAKTREIESAAYRTIMQTIITRVVMITIMVVFMFLIELYFTRPVIRIQKSLSNYLKSDIPFSATTEGNDEISQLREDIETLIAAVKNKDNG